MEEEREDGLEWHPIYVSETATAVRYVLAEDPADAEDRLWDAYGEDGAFRDAVDAELQFTCSVELSAAAGPPREGLPDPDTGWDAVSEAAGEVALGIWRDIASRCFSEMRLDDIAGRRSRSA